MPAHFARRTVGWSRRPSIRHFHRGASQSFAFRSRNVDSETKNLCTFDPAQANEILRVREKMFDLYADHCKFPDEERETARKRFGTFPLRTRSSFTVAQSSDTSNLLRTQPRCSTGITTSPRMRRSSRGSLIMFWSRGRPVAATMVEYPLPQVLKSRGRLRRLVIAHYSISESVLNWPCLRSTLPMGTDAICFLTGSVLYSAAQLCPRGGMRSADLGVATASVNHDLRLEGIFARFRA